MRNKVNTISLNVLPNLFLLPATLYNFHLTHESCPFLYKFKYIYISFSVRKAYHKLSLLVHPDRVEEKEKVEATEKFKVLGKIHSILSDKEKKAIYDESGKHLQR